MINLAEVINMLNLIDYQEFTKLMSPLEVALSQKGSCHDQVMLELQELYTIGLNPKAKFILAVDEDGMGLETHSFVYFTLNRTYYWLENAWEDMKGLHKFSSYDEMIDNIMYYFGSRFPFDKLYIADFNPADHTIGEDLDTLVDICMDSAIEYEV